MNLILKNILKGVEAVGVQIAGPAGQIVDASIHKIIDHQGTVESNVLDAAEAGIQVIEGIKGADIANEAMFRTSIAGLHYNFTLLKASLKPSGGTV